MLREAHAVQFVSVPTSLGIVDCMIHDFDFDGA
jgi:hypothetical protein